MAKCPWEKEQDMSGKTEQPVRVGVIGFGRQGENHTKAMQKRPQEFRLRAVCDITPSRQQVARDVYGMEAYADMDAFLATDVELAFITTNSSSHRDFAVRAAAAGKHVMVEKPLCMNGKEAADMLAAARRHGVLLSCFQQRRWDVDACRVRKALRDGLVGEPFLIENRSAGGGPAVGYGTPDFNQQWRVTRALGGGTIYDFGPHWFDQVLSLLPGQQVVQVFADVRHFTWGDADDYFDVKLVFANGCRATVSKCDIGYVKWPKWLIHGTTGGLRYDDTCVVRNAAGEQVIEEGDARPDMFANLYAAVRQGQPLAVTAEQAERTIKLIDAAFASAEAGRSLDVMI